uniref:Uncharacterized protein n=1 Tax=Anguilla anguilla TaxID=7936 RepID=A0A0E9V110_ANGAN
MYKYTNKRIILYASDKKYDFSKVVSGKLTTSYSNRVPRLRFRWSIPYARINGR